MSLTREADGFQPENFDSEPREEFPYGVWVPFSAIYTDLYREDYPPSAEQLFRPAKKILQAVRSECQDNKILLRGSTLSYQLLLLQGVERRGTFSMAAATGLYPAISENQQSITAQLLSELVHASDIDLVLEGISAEDFEVVNNNIQTAISKNMRIAVFPNAANTLVLGHAKGKNLVTPHRVTSLSNTNGRYEKNFIVISFEDGTVAGTIPYGQVVIRTQTGKQLTTIFWTPQEMQGLENVQDTRRDPRYSLSWDHGATGEINSLPITVATQVASAQELKKNTEKLKRRVVNSNGVFLPAEGFSRDPQKDIWIHIDQTTIECLGSPIEVGERFSQLPVIDQVKLAVRAAQKGALAEENLQLTTIGREALVNSKAPAISDRAKNAFLAINPAEFISAFESLSENNKDELQKELMRDMLIGFFYPQKFIEYCQETGIFRFFPQLKDISQEQWNAVVANLPSHDMYTRAQYTATHFAETHVEIKSVDLDLYHKTKATAAQWVEERQNYDALINPYYLFVESLAKVAPYSTPGASTIFYALDILLDVEERIIDQGTFVNNSIASTNEEQGKYADLAEHVLFDLKKKKEDLKGKIELASKPLNFTVFVGIIHAIFHLTNSETQFYIGAGASFIAANLIFALGALTTLTDKDLEEINESLNSSKEDMSDDTHQKG